jgi:sporulation protein YlmC with PRC-barrel domain
MKTTGTKVSVAMISVLSILLLATMSFAQAVNPSMYRASKLIGADVENPQGEDLGDIEEVVIDSQTGRIAYAVLAFGGFLGLGEKYYAVPFAALTPAPGERPGDRERYLLNVDQERLKNAPGFDRNNWPNMADRTWGEKLYSYYGVTPFWQEREARMVADTTPTQERREARMQAPAGDAEMFRGAAVSATVQNIDQNAKSIQLRTVNNETVQLQAPAALLSTLQTGDRVEVVIRKAMPR